jgi:hypothetical protein
MSIPAADAKRLLLEALPERADATAAGCGLRRRSDHLVYTRRLPGGGRQRVLLHVMRDARRAEARLRAAYEVVLPDVLTQAHDLLAGAPRAEQPFVVGDVVLTPGREWLFADEAHARVVAGWFADQFLVEVAPVLEACTDAAGVRRYAEGVVAAGGWLSPLSLVGAAAACDVTGDPGAGADLILRRASRPMLPEVRAVFERLGGVLPADADG